MFFVFRRRRRQVSHVLFSKPTWKQKKKKSRKQQNPSALSHSLRFSHLTVFELDFFFLIFFVFFFFFVVLFSLSVTRKLSHCLSECYSTCFDVTLNKRTLSLCPRTQFFTEENKDCTHIGNEAPYIVCSGMSHATYIRVPGEGSRFISPHIRLLLPMVWVQVGGRACALQVLL